MEVPPEAPQRIYTGAAQESTGPFESQLSKVVQELKELKLGIQSRFNKAVGASLAIQARRTLNAVSSSHHKWELFIPHPSLSQKLSTFLGDLLAKFKTPEQAEALEYVIAGDSHLLLVGLTAMGKSLVYMLPATQHNSGITHWGRGPMETGVYMLGTLQALAESSSNVPARYIPFTFHM